MEGYLKKYTSIFWGYQDRWVTISSAGLLTYYEKEPDNYEDQPRGKLNLALAEVERKDGRYFKVISADGNKFSFRAESEEEAENWIQGIEFIQSALDGGHLSDDEEQFENLEREEVEDLRAQPDDDEGADNQNGEDNEEEGDKEDEADSSSRCNDDNQQDDTSLLSRRVLGSFKDVVRTVMTAEQVTAQFRRLMIQKKRKNFQVVAAIDFGSSSTGCAFSLKSEYKKDPKKMHFASLGEGNLKSKKQPTILLLNPNGEFDSFGSRAEEKYSEIEQEDNEEAKKWYFFRNFKMQLYNNKNLSKLLVFKDICNKPFKAEDVFALCIEYIKDKVFKRIQEENDELAEYDVRWVLTCPATWNEAARQFMLEAAEEGGIDRNSISLVLEPEAAAVYCKCLAEEDLLEGKKGDIFSPGSRFLIVDLGGGVVDITANEVLETGQLREIYNASGGPWGGNLINHKIWILIYDTFGHAVIQNFMNDNRNEYLNMVRAIEVKKQNFDFRSKFVIDIPDKLQEEAERLNSDMIYTKNKNAVKVVRGKMQIESEIIYNIFKECIDTLCTHMTNLLQKDQTNGVSTILMVGGYSSCGLLQSSLEETFPNLKIIYPPVPDTIVLKGAVMMGHMDTPIAKRLARFHYGIAVHCELDLTKSFDGTLRGKLEAEKEFKVFIKKGYPIKVNDVVAEYELPVCANQEKVIIEVYASDQVHPPEKVNEFNCRQIGTIRIKLSGISNDTILRVGISCDGTEFKAVARDNDTGRCFAGICRFFE